MNMIIYVIRSPFELKPFSATIRSDLAEDSPKRYSRGHKHGDHVAAGYQRGCVPRRLQYYAHEILS